MTPPTLLYIIALIFALVAEFQAQGRSIVGWAVVCLALGLLWGKLG
jgi:hypothetical protein